jgi:hypothetical protein
MWMQSLVGYVSLGAVTVDYEERHNLRRLWGHLSKRIGTSRKDAPAESALAAPIVFPNRPPFESSMPTRSRND